jgi:N-methylhydantoinase A
VADGSADPRAACVGERRVFLDDEWVTTPIFAREALLAGNRFAGPAVVVEMSATTFLAPGWEGTVDRRGNLALTRRGLR